MAIVEQRNRIDNAADEIFKLANLSPEQFSYGAIKEILHSYFSNDLGRCKTCGGKWSVYMGCSRSWQQEPHCFGCRKPVENCTC